MMIKIDVYSQEGKIVGQEELNPEVFGVEPKPELIHQVVVGLLANQRYPWAQTKVRGDVRGGGIKPWRQKGTGRARAGSIRSPLWRGGGIVFGPDKKRVYRKKINNKIRRKALLMCLSDKVKENRMYVLDNLVIPEIKTKKFNSVITNLINSKKFKKVLISLPDKDLNVIKSGRNIKGVKMIPVVGLNVFDLLRSDYLLTTLKGVKKIQEYFGGLCYSSKEKPSLQKAEKQVRTVKSPKKREVQELKQKTKEKKTREVKKEMLKKRKNLSKKARKLDK